MSCACSACAGPNPGWSSLVSWHWQVVLSVPAVLGSTLVSRSKLARRCWVLPHWARLRGLSRLHRSAVSNYCSSLLTACKARIRPHVHAISFPRIHLFFPSPPPSNSSQRQKLSAWWLLPASFVTSLVAQRCLLLLVSRMPISLWSLRLLTLLHRDD